MPFLVQHYTMRIRNNQYHSTDAHIMASTCNNSTQQHVKTDQTDADCDNLLDAQATHTKHPRTKKQLYNPTDSTETFLMQGLQGIGLILRFNKSVVSVVMYNLVYLIVVAILGCSIEAICFVLLLTCVQIICETICQFVLLYFVDERFVELTAMLAGVCLLTHTICTVIACTLVAKVIHAYAQ